MKSMIAIFLSAVLLITSVVFAVAAIPPWYRKEGDRILHVEGRDENDPYIAYDERGSVYTMQVIHVGFTCDDFEEAKQIGAYIMNYSKALPGVTDATTNDFLYHEGWENYYLIRVQLEYPFDTYDTVYDSLNRIPGITRVVRAYLDTAVQETQLYYGDVDFNGNVTAADARQILRYSVLLDTPEDYHISFGDFDADGVLSALDARFCLRVAVHLDATKAYDGE